MEKCDGQYPKKRPSEIFSLADYIRDQEAALEEKELDLKIAMAEVTELEEQIMDLKQAIAEARASQAEGVRDENQP